jgi:hypothetical protein
MKKLFPLILFTFIVSGAYANDINGTWKANIQGDGGGMELTFVFKVADGKLTGVVKSPNGDIEISNTKVNGKEFSFDVSFGDMTIKHNGTLKDDGTIDMKVSGTPMGDTSMVLKRA